jgi:glutathione S-transferase
MIQLHTFPGTAGFAVHLLLREIGVPFELVRVDLRAGAHRQPAFLALNPNGTVPVLVDGPLVLHETAAIGLHLVEAYPQAGLAPAPGTPERAQFLKWMVWMTNTLQTALMVYFNPQRWVAEGDEAAAAQVKARAVEKVQACLALLDAQVAAAGDHWLLGERFSAADAYAFMLCRWTRGFAQRPAREWPHLGPYLQRMLARPAVRATFEAEGIAAPYV